MLKRTESVNGTVEALFSWGAGRGSGRFRSSVSDRAESAKILADVYVPRGSDLQARDRIVRANGEKYVVVGHALWDQAAAFTGHNFGWMQFQVESTNG
jgi:hypothetical protein